MFSIQLFYHQEELQENDTLRKGTHLMKKNISSLINWNCILDLKIFATINTLY